MRLRFILILLVLFTTANMAVTAQDQTQKPGGGTPKVVLPEVTHDIGIIKAGVAVSYTFKVKNEGAAELQILSVAPS